MSKAQIVGNQNVESWLADYVAAQHRALDSVSLGDVDLLINTLRGVWLRDAQVFAIGNGGNAANASHFATDLGKGASDKLSERLAIRMLGEQSDQESYVFLTKQTNALLAGKLSRAIALDLLDALDMHGKNTKLANSVRNQRARAAETLSQKWLAAISETDALREFRVCLEGGDAARGKQLFHQKVEIQCVRCHRMDGLGTSAVGPDLTDIGRARDREYLLRSIVTPGADIAKNFEFALLLLDDGNVITGVVRQEDEMTLSIEFITGSETKQVTVDKDSIEERKATSAMPLLANLMSKRDLRDLIEYLAVPTSSLSHEDKDR
jgi:quinoprotein glucose dehydrogenase